MKVVGNCPSCGNPIWADGPEVTKRTCFCVVPIRTQPITIQIDRPPYPAQPYYQPIYPYWTAATGGTQVSGNTFSTTPGIQVQPPKPPDEDAGMVT